MANFGKLIIFPETIIKEIDRLVFSFVWKGSTHKVKKNVIIQTEENGGLKMADIESTLKAEQVKWIRYYLGNQGSSCFSLMEKAIGEQNINFLLRGDYKVDSLRRCSSFYSSVLTNWKYIRDGNLLETDPYIFCNQQIHIAGNMVYSNKLRLA